MIRRIAKALIGLTPYRVLHGPANRFDAIEPNLTLLKAFGYEPRVVIDGGAHLGSFARLAGRLWPAAVTPLLEPQPACQAALGALAKGGRHIPHSVALGSAEDAAAGLKLSVEDQPTTGAHIADDGVAVQVATLDSLVQLTAADRTLLKMDLQGYELQALRGAGRMLGETEVILTEVSFFAQAYEPPIARLVDLLDRHGFELFDVAALSSRTRDGRLRQGDLIFVRRGSPVSRDTRWA